jgi:hypothetical protein
MLATDTTEDHVANGAQRTCVKNTGRYIDPSKLVGDRPIEANLTIESILRQKWRTSHLSCVELAVSAFMPGVYVDDGYLRDVLSSYLSFT